MRTIQLSEAHVYSMRELNQHTARVLEEINTSGEPAAITKHGRFVALITPLADAQVESIVLREGAIADELHERASDSQPEHISSEQLLKDIDQHYG